MITASVAIGVFSAGAGLGTVIAVRSAPGGGEVMRLSAGTYLLDDQAEAWSPSASSGSDQPVTLSGADAGSTIAGGAGKGGSRDARVCLTTTTDGHAVGTSGEGCVALPVLALAAAASPLVQRPGNPKSTPTPPTPPKTTKPSPPKTNAPAPKSGSAPVQPAPNPGPVQPPAPPPVANPQPARLPAPPAPTPTERISGNISQSESESGSVIERPAEKQIEVVSPPKPAPEPGATKSSAPSRPSQQPPSGNKPSQPQPTGGNKPSQPQPTGGNKPSQPQPTGGNRSQPPPAAGNRTPQPGETTRNARPTGTLRPAIRSGTGQPIVPPGNVRPPTAPPATRPTDDAGAPSPRTQPSVPPGATTPRAGTPTAPGGSLKPVQPPQPSVGPGENSSQGPDGTVLMSATPQLPGGQNGVSLPVFEDPELLRRAYEALGLDRGMRYTDENGVWDLNIAPPGTPPCRNYTTEELQALSTSQGPSPTQSSQTIPRDSCLWPAFIRWLYAEPASGEVSNWTKFTGLPQRNLELVVTDPAPVPLPQPVPSENVPGRSDQGQEIPGHEVPGQNDPSQEIPGQSDPGQLSPAQPGAQNPGDSAPAQRRSGENTQDRTAPFQPDQGRTGQYPVEPDPLEYDGQ
ncbi:hypothetical protein OG884_15905 [Streptosporangium sp. NBC_01755]|uniref:hypothetical protein n=1 Tax=Streptosporangium sp. NBC_01755 TaxID=2975949 RepID=UPI002DDA2FC2|nr:hypothetical protein [Streptosporangium sp. NBC_01755]WSD03316.1 hypothetical protein OG884_15905 [Streptosporangium sp. NBC_01755]